MKKDQRFRFTAQNCPKHPSNCTDKWIQNDFSKGVGYYILKSDSRPIGCVALERANSDICYLERLAVLPKHRRQGFGKAIVNHVFAKAKNMGAQMINIGIIADHTELKTWYNKIGFIEGETKKFEHLPFLVTFMTYQIRS
ncbi:GNAT family N-acetyltransferase [Thermodesulfobacteriota bacterium]